MITAPKGTYDVVPPSPFLAVRDQLLAPAVLSGYRYVDTPMFEETALFERGVGEGTDIVGKEMYTFVDKGGRSVTLRPEGTAGVVRAVLERRLHLGGLPVKLRYAGPMFRYERPQAGRFRQFQQVGIEAIGISDPALDAEVVALADAGLRAVGLTGFRLLLNTLGTTEERTAYVTHLRSWLAERESELSEDNRRRLVCNPLRVLDDKDPEQAPLLADAPELAGFLGPESRAYDAEVRAHLTALSVPFEAAPRLVRGLDYYSRTAFELVHDGLGAQAAVGGGGRYDGLSEVLGGPALPGIGWALGMERVLLAIEAEGAQAAPEPAAAVFVVPVGAAGRSSAVLLVHQLRTAGVAADLAYGNRGLKGGAKAAERSGARWVVFIGERDLEAGVVQVKDFDSGEQQAVQQDQALAVLIERAAAAAQPGTPEPVAPSERVSGAGAAPGSR